MAQGRNVISRYEDARATRLEASIGGTVDWTITGCWRMSPIRVNCKIRLEVTLADGSPGIRCTPTDTAWRVRNAVKVTSVKRPCVDAA